MYPVAGSWHWGGGVLSEMGFKDFAGSTVVHAFGGFGALACVMVLGARKGKYTENGIRPIPAHSFPLAAIGVFLLMFGWYGFNGGSVLSADPTYLGLVFTTTTPVQLPEPLVQSLHRGNFEKTRSLHGPQRSWLGWSVSPLMQMLSL